LNEAFRDDRHAPEPIPEATIQRIEMARLDDAPDHVRADIPEWLAPHFQAAFGADWVAEGAALAERPPLDLRVNTLKVERDKALHRLQRLGVEPTPLSPVGLRVRPLSGPRRHPNVQAEEAFRRGRIEVQEEASQLCALLLGAMPGEQVLDICAGGGGKTLALAARMENRGQIYAYDSDKNRLAPIFERLKRAGVRNVQVLSSTPDTLASLSERVDRVLVDAPCTGTGVWRRRPDAKWRVAPEALSRRAGEQDAVLADAAACLKPGGILLYATCSLLPVENEERIAAFLAAHPAFLRIPAAEAWEAALPGVVPPAAVLSRASLLLTPRRTGTDGFFVAALRRGS
jgi:16S rRNA (cytosine967-C5)-methyltransferase